MSTEKTKAMRQAGTQVDMLHGPLMKKIIMFAIPLALSSILQQLFNAADTVVIGRYASSDSMAAVGATGIIINLLLGLFIGLSVGANVVVASLIGMREQEKISKATHTCMAVAGISGILMLCVTFGLSRPMLELLNTPENIIDRSVLYMRIYAFAVPFIMIYNFAASILRSKGDSKRPFVALVIGGVINVLLNLLFVIVLKMDVSGVAIATVISNAISAAMLLVILLREEEPFRLHLKLLRVDKRDFTWMFRIGAPAGLQSIVFSISNMVIQSAVNSFGSDAVAGTTLALNIDFVTYLTVVAFNQATTTFTSQNYAAGEYDRCRKIYRICLFTALAGASFFGIFFFFTRGFWISIFTDNPAVFHYADIRFAYAILFGGIPAIYEITGSTMRGMGVSLLPAVLTIFGTCAFRIIWILVIVPIYHSFVMVQVVYPCSWIVTGIVMMIAFFRVRKKLLP